MDFIHGSGDGNSGNGLNGRSNSNNGSGHNNGSSINGRQAAAATRGVLRSPIFMQSDFFTLHRKAAPVYFELRAPYK